MTILSHKYAQTDNGIIQGLLYVPDLETNDPCNALSKSYIPSKVTRRADLPPTNYNLIAIAPWINPNCTQSYLASARVDPLRGFIFYHPDNNTDKPPGANSEEWELGDGGNWKVTNRYPIYAVSGVVGAEMIQQLHEYSGNVSQVPFGNNITALYDPDPMDYVRIWTEIRVSTPDGLPTMWIFILAVIGVLIVVVAGTSMLMHYVQRRRRISLQRRVVAGEVNLEAMGIRRMTVPINHIQKFPLFTYHYEPEPSTTPPSPTSPRSPRRARTRRSSRDPRDDTMTPAIPMSPAIVSEKGLPSPAAVSAMTANTTATDYQPTCPICLEDYENRITIIRELPCGHIFHPDCIDEFLSEISSLCPICKTSMLPSGYCPKITNGMVRRERAMRKIRDRIVVEDSDGESTHGRIHSWGTNVKKKIFRPSTRSLPIATQERELRSRQSHPPSLTDETRLRMRALAGGGDSDDGRSSSNGRPRCKSRPCHAHNSFRY